MCVHFLFSVSASTANSVTTVTVHRDKSGRFTRQLEPELELIQVTDGSEFLNPIIRSGASAVNNSALQGRVDALRSRRRTGNVTCTCGTVQPPVPAGHGSGEPSGNALWPSLDNHVQSNFSQYIC